MKPELSKDALRWQAIAREYADQYLQPHEVEAELNDGVLPAEITKRNKARAIELGLLAIDVPKAWGGLELSMEEQVAIWEQLGRVTNALSWCFSEPQSWMFEACSDEQIERFILPMMRGERKDCYAITESGPGSDVSGLEATAVKDGADYVLNGEKWDQEGFQQLIGMNADRIRSMRKRKKTDAQIADSILTAMGSTSGYRHNLARKKLIAYLSGFK